MNTNNKNLSLAFNNFKKVCLSNNKKFAHLDEWLYIESRLFCSEMNYKPTSYMKYKLGDILKIEYGVGIGGEISNRHFDIVLTRDDNTKSDCILTVPLTSKPGYGRIMIGVPILEKFVDIINNSVMNISILNFTNDVNKIKNLIANLDNYFYLSYVNPNQIKTISKSRILPFCYNDKVSNYRLPLNKIKIIKNNLCI